MSSEPVLVERRAAVVIVSADGPPASRNTPDQIDGLRAFLEKRRPVFNRP